MKTSLIKFNKVDCSFNVRNGFFKFKKYKILKGITFDLYQGETLGILGGNGAGKTTLLRLLCGIYKPNAGSIEYCKDITVSMLNLQMGFDPELSGRDNAILSGMFLGFTQKEVIERLDEIIDFSELGPRIEDPLKTYSTGMRARLGFGVGVGMSPDVLLIDEVLGVGDQRFQAKSAKAMREKIQSNQTVVFVSHSMDKISSICSRVIWIEGGKILAKGDPNKVIPEYIKKNTLEK